GRGGRSATGPTVASLHGWCVLAGHGCCHPSFSSLGSEWSVAIMSSVNVNRNAAGETTGEIRKYWRNFVGGKWVDAHGTLDVENPATCETVARIALADADDVDQAVRAARSCVDSGQLARMAPGERASLMRQVAVELRDL